MSHVGKGCAARCSEEGVPAQPSLRSLRMVAASEAGSGMGCRPSEVFRASRIWVMRFCGVGEE